MLGKIIDGRLVIAGEKIQIPNGWATKPTEEELIKYGYKKIEYTEKPTYDKEEEKLTEVYNEEQDKIIVLYAKDMLTDEEKRQNLENKVCSLEYEYNMCRWQRELILAENSQASNYTKAKAQEIEDLAQQLR